MRFGFENYVQEPLAEAFVFAAHEDGVPFPVLSDMASGLDPVITLVEAQGKGTPATATITDAGREVLAKARASDAA